jgi:hypothetical protein
MVRRRSTVRFRNGASLKYQVRSSLDSSYPTLWMGAVAVLGGIWEIVGRSRSSGPISGPTVGPVDPARVSREVPGSMAGDGGLPHRRIGDALSTGCRPPTPSNQDRVHCPFRAYLVCPVLGEHRARPRGTSGHRRPGPLPSAPVSCRCRVGSPHHDEGSWATSG